MTVRRESVVLELDDRFTAGMIKAAGATALLDKELNSLDGSTTRSTSSTDRSTSAFTRNAAGADRSAASVSRNSKSLDELDQNARRAERSSSALGDSIALLWPSLIPISALAVPAIAGLSAQLGLAATAAGVAILAFHGVGGALKAMDAYQLAPTTANLSKMQIEMGKLGPAGQHFVRELDKIEPKLKSLKVAAENGLLPGAEEGLTHLLTILPQVRRIIGEVSGATGNLLADAGKNLAGPEFRSFFKYLETDAKPLLIELGQTLGNFAAGFAHMFVGFAPMEHDFSSWLLSVSRSFDSWSQGVAKTQGFADFLDYLHRTGPEVATALGAIGNALVQIVKAGAPMGGPTLRALTAFADVVAAIASSDVGPALVAMASGMALVNRAMAISAGMKGSSLGGGAESGRAGSGARKLAADLGLATGGAQKTAVAMTELAAAEDRLAAASLRAKDAQFALIPSSAKRGAIAEYTAAQNGVAAASGRVTEAQKGQSAAIGKNLAGFGRAAAGAAALGVVMTGAADKIHLTNTATGALIGTMVAPGIGTAIGGLVGGLLDFSHAGDNAAASAKSFQEALKGIDPAPLKAKIAEIKALNLALPDPGTKPRAFGGRGASVGSSLSATKAADDQAAALKRLNAVAGIQSAKEGAANLHFLADGFIAADGATKQATMSTQAFETEVTRLNGVLSDRASLRDYQAALDDFRTGLAKVRKDMAGSGEKLIIGGKINIDAAGGRQAQQLLDGIAASALKVVQTLKGVDRVEFMHKARGRFIAAAEAMGIPEAAAKRLANRLLGLDQLRVNPKVDINTARADAKRRALQAALNQLNNTHANPTVGINDHATAVARQIQAAINGIHGKTVSINTVHNDSFISKRIQQDSARHAAGGPIVGPGTATSDQVPIWASNGEYVMKTAAVEKYGVHMFDRLNAMTFAQGGRVGRLYDAFNVNDALPTPPPNPNMTTAAVRADLNAFRKAIRAAGGAWTQSLAKWSHQLIDNAKVLDKELRRRDQLTQTLADEKDQLKQLQADRTSYGQGIASGFLSDAFHADSSDGSVAGLAAFDQTVRQNTFDAKAFQTALTTAVAKGLDGSLFKDLAASNNLSLAQQFASLSAAEIASRETAYMTRAAVAQQVGDYAGQKAFAAQLSAQSALIETTNETLVAANQAVKELTAQLKRQSGDVESGAERGTRAGFTDAVQTLNRKVGAR